jgi:YVTN family beta-propeller protein
MTPGPNVVAPSAIDDRATPPPIQMAPSPAQPAGSQEHLVQPISPTIAGSAQGLLAYVVNRTSNDVTVVDLAGNAVRTTIGVGRSPQEVAALPDGSRVFVANQADNTISVIDPGTNQVVATWRSARTAARCTCPARPAARSWCSTCPTAARPAASRPSAA